ncbi:hypothetical protein [Halorussus halophilus]|uniref:hypothetical protein n=1 Tax=Halorussus halophilus TaxID=2650975 RepID=UPI0013015760|nr:hypothetical protein [Halorussus halophilus]
MATPTPPAQDRGQSVEVEQFSVERLTLRNVTVTDAVVRELTVRRVGSRENVTLRNVSAQQLTVRRATLSEVRFGDMVVRDRRLAQRFGFNYAAGGNVTNESRANVLVRNRTLDGIVVERLSVQTVRGLNVSGNQSAASVATADADLVVGNASVGTVQSARLRVGNRSESP